MMGCRKNAKNTLDKNYLYLAEKRGLKIFAETRVVDVVPLDGADCRKEWRLAPAYTSTSILILRPCGIRRDRIQCLPGRQF